MTILANTTSQTSDKASVEVFVGRQPIFDRAQDVIGYELLFRSSTQNVSTFPDGAVATAEVIANSLLAVGFEKLVGNRRAFINFDRRMLMSEWATFVPADRLVIEILESVRPEPEILTRCKELASLGYQFALDDFIGNHELAPLIELVDFLKVDFAVTTPEQQREIAKRYGKGGLKLLAEKVEDREQFASARDAGYNHFQGYFFAKPSIVKTTHLPPAKTISLRLLAELSKPSLDFRKLETLIREDVALPYQLLKYVNSAAFSWQIQIESIHQAFILLGDQEVRRWITMSTLSRLAHGKPKELISHALFRARFSELIVSQSGANSNGQAYLLGMLSVFDAIMDRPLSEILSELNLSTDLKGILLRSGGEENPLSDVLTVVRGYESELRKELLSSLSHLKLSASRISELYLEAISWADRLLQQQELSPQVT